MMSGMLAALGPGSGAKNPDLREHCERLIIHLHDPYLRAMLTHLTVGDDWTEVLEEEALPIRERLAIALQFLSDKELSSYLRRTTDRSLQNGNIEGLIFTGLTNQGVELLQMKDSRTEKTVGTSPRADSRTLPGYARGRSMSC